MKIVNNRSEKSSITRVSYHSPQCHYPHVSKPHPTDASKLNASENFKVYPNPTKGKFHVQLKNVPSEGVMVEIRNVVGQKLMEQKIFDNDSEWSVDQFQGKMFFVTLRGTNHLETRRIIIE
jgi:hypothetical protein